MVRRDRIRGFGYSKAGFRSNKVTKFSLSLSQRVAVSGATGTAEFAAFAARNQKQIPRTIQKVARVTNSENASSTSLVRMIARRNSGTLFKKLQKEIQRCHRHR
jgi:hypothetical protein